MKRIYKTFGNGRGHMLIERLPDGRSLTTTVDVFESFQDGVQIVRRSVDNRGFDPGSSINVDLRFRLDPDNPNVPAPWENDLVGNLYLNHLDDIIRVAADLGCSLSKSKQRDWLLHTKGHGCLPVHV